MSGREIGTAYAGSTESDRPEASELPADHEGRPETGEAPEVPTNHLGFKDQPVREFREQYPDEYLEPMNRMTVKVEPFSDPYELAEKVNPDVETGPEYQLNCADSARSFERGWRGNVEEAAGRAPQIDHVNGGLVVSGESAERTEEWAGERFSDVYDSGDLRLRVQAAGHGASAIVATWDHEGSFGHAYNVVNYQGTVRVVDPQWSEVHPWSERSIHPELSDNCNHRAMAWDAKGQRLW